VGGLQKSVRKNGFSPSQQVDEFGKKTLAEKNDLKSRHPGVTNNVEMEKGLRTSGHIHGLRVSVQSAEHEAQA